MKGVYMFLKFLYWKWIKRRCPHICTFCAWKSRECYEEFKATGKL